MKPARTLYCFLAEVLHPTTEEIEDCEVIYAVEDCGVLMRPNEDDRAVLRSVTARDGKDILPLLDADTVGNLEREAMEWFADEMDVRLYGSESV